MLWHFHSSYLFVRDFVIAIINFILFHLAGRLAWWHLYIIARLEILNKGWIKEILQSPRFDWVDLKRKFSQTWQALHWCSLIMYSLFSLHCLQPVELKLKFNNINNFSRNFLGTSLFSRDLIFAYQRKICEISKN